MVLGQVNDDGDEHWESLLLVGLQNLEEVVVLEEAHGSVSNLQVDAAYALDDSLEELWNEMLDFVDFANLEHFLQFGQEECLLDAVSEWPVLEETL